MLRAQPDGAQELLDPAPTLVAAVQAVDAQRLGDDLAHRHPRVQRRVRILEDDLDVSPDGPHLPALEAGDVLALEHDLAGGRLEQLDDGPSEGRLAATRLSDDAERLAGLHRQVDAVHRLHLPDRVLEEARLDREVLDEPFDPEERVAVRRRALGGDRGLRLAHEVVARAGAGAHGVESGELFGEVAGGSMRALLTACVAQLG